MSSSGQNTHLSDTQFTDLLLGSIPRTVSAHLQSCPDCAQEARRVSSSIVSFQQETRVWAEHHAATLPASVPPARSNSWLHVPGFSLGWQAACALTLLCAGMSLSYQVQQHGPGVAQTAAIAHSQHPVSTLQSDNELLSAIDVELQAAAAPPPSVYGLDGSGVRSRLHPAHEVRD